MAYVRKETTTEVVRTEADRGKQQAERERIPFGVPRSKLDVFYKVEGYHLHWINDDPGRIFEAQQGGYEFVKPSEVGFEDKESKVWKLVGRSENGDPINAYLMKLRLDWYEADQAKINEKQDAFDQAIKRGTLDNSAGRYVPSSGISIRNN